MGSRSRVSVRLCAASSSGVKAPRDVSFSSSTEATRDPTTQATGRGPRPLELGSQARIRLGAAARELREETGLELPLVRVDSPNPDVALYLAEAPHDTGLTLDAEHDMHRWLPLEAAAELCLPAAVAEGLRAAASTLI
jgi:8-oxo-dGTP pyrophosphatase MutT (NUDIX family)